MMMTMDIDVSPLGDWQLVLILMNNSKIILSFFSFFLSYELMSYWWMYLLKQIERYHLNLIVRYKAMNLRRFQGQFFVWIRWKRKVILLSDNNNGSHLLLVFCVNDGIRRRLSLIDGGWINRGGVPIDGDISLRIFLFFKINNRWFLFYFDVKSNWHDTFHIVPLQRSSFFAYKLQPNDEWLQIHV